MTRITSCQGGIKSLAEAPVLPFLLLGVTACSVMMNTEVQHAEVLDHHTSLEGLEIQLNGSHLTSNCEAREMEERGPAKIELQLILS